MRIKVGLGFGLGLCGGSGLARRVVRDDPRPELLAHALLGLGVGLGLGLGVGVGDPRPELLAHALLG